MIKNLRIELKTANIGNVNDRDENHEIDDLKIYIEGLLKRKKELGIMLGLTS
jgi:hypothetical protein